MESEDGTEVCVEIVQPDSSFRQQSLGFGITSVAETMTSEHRQTRDEGQAEDDIGIFMNEDEADGPESSDGSKVESSSDDAESLDLSQKSNGRLHTLPMWLICPETVI